uniref:Small ribosomal subunit protein mS38 n=1 Tax=Physcomitrium patens TaxID=3218 RepID=A0A2K1IQQ9_PHYPA|nr:hypothetical protein PHYPA_025735 [Physcomitrium patens]
MSKLDSNSFFCVSRHRHCLPQCGACFEVVEAEGDESRTKTERASPLLGIAFHGVLLIASAGDGISRGEPHVPSLAAPFVCALAREAELPYFDVSCNGSPRESEGVFSHVERTRFENFVMQPESSLSLLDWESDVVRVQALVKAKLSVVQAWNGESCEPDCGLKLGLRLRSGMYLPSRQEEEGWELSSVKRKRKKKMNKHKQRKLRRRDRHRK